jgi:hypothetical protein
LNAFLTGATCCGLLLGTFVLLPSHARAQDEGALQDLWKQQVATPDDHDALLKSCQEFTTAHANDPLLPVVRGLTEWHLLRAKRQPEAWPMLGQDLAASGGPVAIGAQRLALAWATRVDREQVAKALQAWYRKEVAYPKTLDLVRPLGTFPAADRFGKPWIYKLTGFAKLPGFTDQKYSLQSPVLGDVSDFQGALQLPYAARISAVPVQVQAAEGGTPTVKFNIAGSAALVGVGQAAGDLYLAYVGAHVIVVCDYTHWRILPRP